MLVENLLHLLERHAELLGQSALRTMQDQIAALLWLGHGASSVLGDRAGGGSDHKRQNSNAR
jgi:hypothetical protein